MSALEIMQQRGFWQQVTPGIEELFAAGPVTFYLGVDPTGPSLHVGHMVGLMASAQLQRAGHRPVLVLGAGTALVGDPTGKDEMRRLLTPDDVERNGLAIRRQLERYVDLSPGRGVLRNNADWLLGLGYIEFLRDVGRHFAMGTMLAKASVKQRLERGMSFLEFNYQVLQAYDYLVLHREEGCRLQVGGDDQWGNITAGMELIRRVEGAEVHCLTWPLITTAGGKKMGKTESGAVWLDPALCSPYDYYQYWVNVGDADVGRFLRMFTFLPLERVQELEALQGAELREAKRVLAWEATAILHGAEEANGARDGALAAFAGEGDVEAMPAFVTAVPVALLDVLVASGLCESKGDARRQVRGGGVRLADVRVEDEALTLTAAHFAAGAVVLARGKKQRVRLVQA